MTFAVYPDNSSAFREPFPILYRSRKEGSLARSSTPRSWNPILLVRKRGESAFLLAELRVRHSHPQAVKRMAGAVTMLQDDFSSYAFE